MKKNNYSAFTLVELIVVITILAVLATVAFISFQGYTSSSRDSVRLADLKNISKSFEFNRTKWIDFPLPDKKVDISSSGTIFQYQWELSQNILNSDLNIFDGWVDPLSGENYGYAVNAARNKFQIIWFLENQQSVANILLNKTFADNLDKYVKTSGDTLGILLDETNREVVNSDSGTTQIEVDTTTQNYIPVFTSHQTLVSGSGTTLWKEFSFHEAPTKSCLNILRSGNSKGSWKYTINPQENTTVEVMCDMDYLGWGWTGFYGIDVDDVLSISGSYSIGNQDFNELSWLTWWRDLREVGFNEVMIRTTNFDDEVAKKSYELVSTFTMPEVWDIQIEYGVKWLVGCTPSDSVFNIKYKQAYGVSVWEVGTNRWWNGAMDWYCSHGVWVSAHWDPLIRHKWERELNKNAKAQSAIFYIR